jgi:hypothetical protein
VAQLRKKVELDPSHTRHLLTDPGIKYRLVPAGRGGRQRETGGERARITGGGGGVATAHDV